MPRCLLFVLGLLLTMTAASAQDQSLVQQLNELYAAEWETTLRDAPTFASHLGDRRYNDRWPDMSLPAIERRHAHQQEVLAKLTALDPATAPQRALPTAQDRLNYLLFKHQLETDLEEYPFRWWLVPLNQREGIQDENSLADALSFKTVKDYEDWIARLRSFGVMMDQTIALMREGIRRGLVQPKVTMQRVPAQIQNQRVAQAEDSPFYKPFRHFDPSISDAEQKRLTSAALLEVRESVLPAFERFGTFFNGEYLPACLDGVERGDCRTARRATRMSRVSSRRRN